MKDILKELKKDLGKNIVIGTERVLKGLKQGKMGRVYLSSNCPDKVKEDIEQYKDLFGAELVQLSFPNDELGHISKKQYHISVLGILKEN